MDLKKMNLVELNQNEMLTVEGGSWIGRAWEWIKEHVFLSAGVAEGADGNTYGTVSAGASF